MSQISVSVRYASHPSDSRLYTTATLREHFLIDGLFQDDQMKIVYSHYDRFIVGGVKPKKGPVALENIPLLRAEYFLQRREIGIINVGAMASVQADGQEYILKNREALYIGRGVQKVIFNPSKEGETFFYFNSAPAHASYPAKKISLEQAETVEIGSQENCNA